MKNLSLLCGLLFLSNLAMSQQIKTVSGLVSDGIKAMESVNVSIADKNISTVTDAAGKYRIEVAEGDRLQFSYVGMRTVTILVEDVTRTLNIKMVPKIEQLEGVTLEGKSKNSDIRFEGKSQKELNDSYNFDQDIIRTKFGYLNKKTAGYSVQIRDGNKINYAATNILGVLQSMFASVKISPEGYPELGTSPDDPAAVIYLRAKSILLPIAAAYEVDGMLYTDPPLFLNVMDIERVALIAGLAGTVKYGSLGAGGVFVINTKSANFSPTKEQLINREQQPLRKTNSVVNALSREKVAKNAPTYLKELRASSSLVDSKAVFEKYHLTYSNSPYFLLDAYEFFVEKYNEVAFADSIIKEHFTPYANNPVLMKALAYTYESQQRFEKANDIYKEIFILRPNYVQSYMDMANSYRNLKDPSHAAAIYARYNYLIEEGFLEEDIMGFSPIINREFNNLLTLEKGAVFDISKSKIPAVSEKDFKGTRLVFEWNDNEAEFELQHVNRENDYYTWKHGIADNTDEIRREKDFGYNVKEYLMDGSLGGTWKININYLGNKSLTPTYLKATVYYDYGLDTQRKETKVFKLDLKNVNQELFTIASSGRTLTRQ
ncbi:carboxypeptidase-like regulatory domain-containing protein [Croceitalea rosinachiae]|uniref:Carboxypeptidase-like regulatory domain-containing protein n=1 Tax=Croceitalea rosinachiae TaxID=3075596 RepID=A0ABU3AB11_9FLAO|nr:carboxypeptidase-like regulatory domain-containing protein [Croceitalea sp. F388]MDT0607372.1 carboxypeptidase-like regulatory domain-containing protein [Croceitalea sp. F388]